MSTDTFLARSYPESLSLKVASRASGVVDLPGSKSISNRVFLMAALSRADTVITHALESDDTDVMIAALKSLGIWISKGAMGYQVTGCGGRFRKSPSAIFMGNAGTAIRPLTAVLALMPRTSISPIRVHGVARMHERPIGD